MKAKTRHAFLEPREFMNVVAGLFYSKSQLKAYPPAIDRRIFSIKCAQVSGPMLSVLSSDVVCSVLY